MHRESHHRQNIIVLIYIFLNIHHLLGNVRIAEFRPKILNFIPQSSTDGSSFFNALIPSSLAFILPQRTLKKKSQKRRTGSISPG